MIISHQLGDHLPGNQDNDDVYDQDMMVRIMIIKTMIMRMLTMVMSIDDYISTTWRYQEHHDIIFRRRRTMMIIIDDIYM